MRKGKLNAPRTVGATTTATLLSDPKRDWIEVILKNTDASASVFIGTSTVTSSSTNKGFELTAGQSIIFDTVSSRIYGITASGTVNVSVTEIG